jgi:hypothetical protein
MTDGYYWQKSSVAEPELVERRLCQKPEPKFFGMATAPATGNLIDIKYYKKPYIFQNKILSWVKKNFP